MRYVFVIVLLVMTVGAVQAQNSLLPGGEYPAENCRSPLRPLGGDSAREWAAYREDMLRYRACVDAYVRVARDDMRRIQERIDKAVRDYNREATNF